MPGSTPKSSKLSSLSLVPLSERQQLKLVRQLEVSCKQLVAGNSGGNLVESTTLRQRPRSCNVRGETSLHRAAIKGDEEAVAKLLSEGADPNVSDFAGWTPLHEACNHGWFGVASALIQAGASVNAKGFDDDTPLHDAAVNGHSKLVRLLVAKGADVHFRNKRGKTPCDVAAPNLVPHIMTIPCSAGSVKVKTVEYVTSGSTQNDDLNSTAIPEVCHSTFFQGKGVSNTPKLKFKFSEIKKKRGKAICGETKHHTGRSKFLGKMDEKNAKEDIYEFKSSKEATPVRGNSASPEVEKNVSELKIEKTGDGFSSTETESSSTKRSLTEMEDLEETEDEVKKKKRKDTEGKEAGGPMKALSSSAGRVTGVRNNASGMEKNPKTGNHLFGKNSGTACKTISGGLSTPSPSLSSSSSSSLPSPSVMSVSNTPSSASSPSSSSSLVTTATTSVPLSSSSSSSLSSLSSSSSSSLSNAAPDRKSPSSPKASGVSSTSIASSVAGTKSESEQEDKPAVDGEKTDPGPKVPPLKIVIPQQTANEPEQGNRNGKNNVLRHHQALPYVVTSNGNDGEKEGTRSRSASPGDPFKSDEKKDGTVGVLCSEDQKGSLHHQRVLRSSHRSGPGGNGDSRPPDPLTPRSSSNNGSGPVSSVGPGAINPSASNVIGTNGAACASSTENSPPQNQRGSSPMPQVEASSCATGTCISSAGDGSGSALPSSNHRINLSNANKPNGNTSNLSLSGVSDEKTSESNAETSQTQSQVPTSTPAPVELHPRKRKLKHNKEVKETPLAPATTERCESTTASTEIHPHEQPVKNSYQLFLDIRKQIERRRKGLFPVQPKPPQGFKDYLMNRCTYVLAGNASSRQIPSSPLPQNLTSPMKDLFTDQEKERHRLRLQHVIEKEKLVLSVEQEILRVHGRAARILANQSLPFSACTILKDEEVYNFITPEQEEKDRNARPRYNGRLFLSWLQDVDDKWEKIKEAMLLRHHNEAESLHAVQKMDWEWKMKELGSCEFKSKPVILDCHVPMVHVSDDFDLLPA